MGQDAAPPASTEDQKRWERGLPWRERELFPPAILWQMKKVFKNKKKVLCQNTSGHGSGDRSEPAWQRWSVMWLKHIIAPRSKGQISKDTAKVFKLKSRPGGVGCKGLPLRIVIWRLFLCRIKISSHWITGISLFNILSVFYGAYRHVLTVTSRGRQLPWTGNRECIHINALWDNSTCQQYLLWLIHSCLTRL